MGPGRNTGAFSYKHSDICSSSSNVASLQPSAAAIKPQTKRRPILANRNFNRKQALEKEVKDLFAKITFGASGAPTLTTGYGIASIVRDEAGTYTLTLADKYVSFKHASGTFLKSSAEDIRLQLTDEDVSTDKTVEFKTLTGASATDPSSGAGLFLQIVVKNTTVA
jgi:hypothetical protein